MLLIAIQNIPSRKINAGDTFRTESPEVFLKKGLARRLSKEKIDGILDAYVEEAEKVFMSDNTEPGKREMVQGVLF